MSLPGLVVTLELGESDRQLVLLALAVLSLRSPGFDDALNRVACRIDNAKGERADIYDAFRKARGDVVREGTVYTAILLGVAIGLGLEGKVTLLCEQCAADLGRCAEEAARAMS